MRIVPKGGLKDLKTRTTDNGLQCSYNQRQRQRQKIENTRTKIAERNAREEKGNRIKRKEKKREKTEKSIEGKDFEKLERKGKEKIKKYKEN